MYLQTVGSEIQDIVGNGILDIFQVWRCESETCSGKYR